MLAVSIGNTSVFAGVFEDGRLVKAFRGAPDFEALMRRAGRRIGRTVFCSVVPVLTPKFVRAARRAWKIEALELRAAGAHGLKIGYRRPAALGADRVAAALGVRKKFPREDAIVVDCGTATTVTAVRRDGMVLGGAIFPGVALWPAMLAARAAQLRAAGVKAQPRAALGRSPAEGIASGVFFGHVGAIREVVARVRAEAFGAAGVLVVATGGNAERFVGEKLFDAVEPHLVLEGLRAWAAELGLAFARGRR